MYLAWREIKKNKGKYALITFIMVLIVYLVLFIIGLALGLQQLAASQLMNNEAQSYFVEEGRKGSLNTSNLPRQELEEFVSNLDDDQAFVLSQQLATIKVDGEGENQIDVSFYGIEEDSPFYPEVMEGRLPENEEEVIVSAGLATEGVEIGNTIVEDESEEAFTVVGFSDDATFNYADIVFLTPDQFERIQRPSSYGDQPTGQAVVSMASLDDLSVSKEDLDEYGLEAFTADEIIEATPGYTAQNATFLLMIVFMYVISALIIAVFFYVITLQKLREYGQLKAIGAQNSFLAKTLIEQVSIIMITAILISYGLILATAYFLPDAVPFLIDNGMLILASVTFFVFALIGSAFSLLKVTRVDPIDAIGGNN